MSWQPVPRSDRGGPGRGLDAVIQVGDLVLDRDQFRVERSGKRIDLTAKEFSVLECLMLNARRSVTRSM